MGCHFLFQGIFPTQGSNPGLQHCRQTLYHLSHQESIIYSVPHVQLQRWACYDMRMLWTRAFSVGDPRLPAFQHRMFKVTTSWLDLAWLQGWLEVPSNGSFLCVNQATHKHQVLVASRLSLGKINDLNPVLLAKRWVWAQSGAHPVCSELHWIHHWRCLVPRSWFLASLHVARFGTLCSIRTPQLQKGLGSIIVCEVGSVHQMRKTWWELNRGPQGRLFSPFKEEWC